MIFGKPFTQQQLYREKMFAFVPTKLANGQFAWLEYVWYYWKTNSYMDCRKDKP